MFNVYSKQQDAIERMHDAKKKSTIAIDTRVPGVVLPEALLNKEEIRLSISPNIEILFKNSLLHVELSFQGKPFACQIPVNAIWAVMEFDSNGKALSEEVFEDSVPPEYQSKLTPYSDTEIDFLSKARATDAQLKVEVQHEKKDFIEGGLADQNNMVRLIVDSTSLGVDLPDFLKNQMKVEIDVVDTDPRKFLYITRSVYSENRTPALVVILSSLANFVATLPLDSIYGILVINAKDSQLVDQVTYEEDVPQHMLELANLFSALEQKYGQELLEKVYPNIDFNAPIERIEKAVAQAIQAIKKIEANRKQKSQKDNTIQFSGFKKPNKRK